MTKLISDWQVDAYTLQEKGLKGIHLLDESSFLRSQALGRALKDHSPDLSLSFLPQTYASASFLFALLDPLQIVAIPEGMRRSPHLYPKEKMDKVLLNIDRHYSEQIALRHSSLAFVSTYSLPQTVNALKKQGVQTVTLDDPNTFEDICSSLRLVGDCSNQSMKSELLCLFMESALLAMDNHLYSVRDKIQKSPPLKLLFLYKFKRWATPSSHTLTGQMLDRLGVENLARHFEAKSQKSQWQTPLNSEQIIHIDPDCIVVGNSQEKPLDDFIMNLEPFQSMRALQANNVFPVDADTQQEVSQYLVLAYFDLFQAIIAAEAR
ncbi:MAG: iron complex transport system substrate-binding protein [Halioglobus sp.]|jgi:iron complex transport system substrate-binding protein